MPPDLVKHQTTRQTRVRNPNAVRLIRFMRLFKPSVGPFVTAELFQLVIWVAQRAIVRPRRFTSRGSDRSWRSPRQLGGELRSQLRTADLVDVPDALLGVPGITYLSTDVGDHASVVPLPICFSKDWRISPMM